MAPGEKQAAKPWAGIDKTVILRDCNILCFFLTPPLTSSIVFDEKGAFVSCTTLRDVLPETQSSCSLPLVSEHRFGWALEPSPGAHWQGSGKQQVLAPGLLPPPSLFLEELQPYPTGSTPSRTSSECCSSHQHGFRTSEDKQIDVVRKRHLTALKIRAQGRRQETHQATLA